MPHIASIMLVAGFASAAVQECIPDFEQVFGCDSGDMQKDFGCAQDQCCSHNVHTHQVGDIVLYYCQHPGISAKDGCIPDFEAVYGCDNEDRHAAFGCAEAQCCSHSTRSHESGGIVSFFCKRSNQEVV